MHIKFCTCFFICKSLTLNFNKSYKNIRRISIATTQRTAGREEVWDFLKRKQHPFLSKFPVKVKPDVVSGRPTQQATIGEETIKLY